MSGATYSRVATVLACLCAFACGPVEAGLDNEDTEGASTSNATLPDTQSGTIGSTAPSSGAEATGATTVDPSAPGTGPGTGPGSEGSDDTTETGTPSHPTNPDLDALESNRWLLLSEKGIEFDGHTAYSGGAYDSLNHQFLVFGGGHWDGWHNDVLAFDIATATWATLSESDLAEDHNCRNVDEGSPGMLLSSMRPASRHTYDQIEFVDHLGQMLIWSGPTYASIWECPAQTLPADTWLFDPTSLVWSYRNVGAMPQPSGEAHSGAYDPVGGLYYAMRNGELWTYNPDSDVWAQLETQGAPTSSSYTRVVTVDTQRQQLWMRPDVYDIPSNTWSVSEAEGAPPPSLSETYDSRNDAIIVHSGLEIFIYDPNLDAWESRTPQDAIADPADSGAGPYGRFFFDAVDAVVIYIDTQATVQAYRY